MVKNIKLINKIVEILIVLIMLSTVFSNIVYAKPSGGAPSGGNTDTGTGGSTTKSDKIIDTNTYAPGNDAMDSPRVAAIAGTVLNVVQVIGIIIAVGCISIVGIQYMVGSVEQKAEYKKTMTAMIVGAILLVSTTTIVKVIYSTVTKSV